MGWFMQEHDIYVGSMLDELNVRFAPAQRHAKSPDMKTTHFGGIEEMAALQKEFKLFKKGRTFMLSLRALNIGASSNDVKNRWHSYLESLVGYPSNQGSEKGDAAIVAALAKNLASKAPLPVHFTSHDLRKDERVVITAKSRPVHYFDADFLTISLPMQPFDTTGKAAAKGSKKPKAAKAAKKSKKG